MTLRDDRFLVETPETYRRYTSKTAREQANLKAWADLLGDDPDEFFERLRQLMTGGTE